MSTAASQPVFNGPIVVMGVSGSGKSSIGERLAAHFGLAFIEGDSLHPAENIAKMSAGIPLGDEDRWPWLDRIGQCLTDAGTSGIVISCSALKRTYRERLRQASPVPLAFVYLKGSREVLLPRMSARPGHFMPSSLLDSQLATLESPQGEARVVTIDVALSPLETAVQAIAGLCALETSER